MWAAQFKQELEAMLERVHCAQIELGCGLGTSMNFGLLVGEMGVC